MSENVLCRLVKILKGRLGVDGEAEIRPDDCLTNLNINSVSFIKLVVEIEKEFGIEFADQDIDINKFRTIQSLLGHIEAYGGTRV